jgi:dGTPase
MKIVKPGYGTFDLERRGGHDSSIKGRKAFEVDKARIIHSAAFRRLQGKTQVLGVGERDFYRTRLTRSIEVAQLGRGLCTELKAAFTPDQDLVEAICLAHDIGHPPFGHSGEDLLHAKMKGPSGGFGANPQNLRIVTRLEKPNT